MKQGNQTLISAIFCCELITLLQINQCHKREQRRQGLSELGSGEDLGQVGSLLGPEKKSEVGKTEKAALTVDNCLFSSSSNLCWSLSEPEVMCLIYPTASYWKSWKNFSPIMESAG